MLISLILASTLAAQSAQGCLDIVDADRRGYDDLTPISVQVDLGGPAASVIPRIYSSRIPKRGKQPARETHWIAFDLKRADGKVTKSMFRFRYGDSRADYWVYALVPCDVNGDGRIDLVFYAGDDTGDETVVLLTRNGNFRASTPIRSRS